MMQAGTAGLAHAIELVFVMGAENGDLLAVIGEQAREAGHAFPAGRCVVLHHALEDSRVPCPRGHRRQLLPDHVRVARVEKPARP